MITKWYEWVVLIVLALMMAVCVGMLVRSLERSPPAIRLTITIQPAASAPAP